MRIRATIARAGWTLLCTAAPCLLPTAAWSAGLSVSPTQIEMPAGEMVRGLRLSNTGNTVIEAQLRVFSWSQDAGEDVLMPSTDLVVSPPMTRIAPGQQQLVRVIRPAQPLQRAFERERSYRLLIDELPAVATETAPRSGLNFVMRYSVPVFLAPDAPAAAAAARLELRRGSDGLPLLHVDNPSPLRAQIADLRIGDAGGSLLLDRGGLLGYVLSGMQRDWPLNLPADALANATEIQVRINGETVRQALPAEPAERGAR